MEVLSQREEGHHSIPATGPAMVSPRWNRCITGDRWFGALDLPVHAWALPHFLRGLGAGARLSNLSPHKTWGCRQGHTYMPSPGVAFRVSLKCREGPEPHPGRPPTPPSQCPSVCPCLGAPGSSEPGAQLLWPRRGHRGSTLAPGSASLLRDSVATSPPVQRTRQSHPFRPLTGAARGLPGHTSLPRLGLSSCGHCRSQI